MLLNDFSCCAPLFPSRLLLIIFTLFVGLWHMKQNHQVLIAKMTQIEMNQLTDVLKAVERRLKTAGRGAKHAAAAARRAARAADFDAYEMQPLVGAPGGGGEEGLGDTSNV